MRWSRRCEVWFILDVCFGLGLRTVDVTDRYHLQADLLLNWRTLPSIIEKRKYLIQRDYVHFLPIEY